MPENNLSTHDFLTELGFQLTAEARDFKQGLVVLRYSRGGEEIQWTLPFAAAAVRLEQLVPSEEDPKKPVRTISYLPLNVGGLTYDSVVKLSSPEVSPAIADETSTSL